MCLLRWRARELLCGCTVAVDRLPPLPSLRALTAELRAINQAFSHPECGPEFVYLFAVASDFPQPAHWRVGVDPNTYITLAYVEHREWVPGDCGELVAETRPDGTIVVDDGSKFDAVAAARRLLAAARDV